MLNKKIGSAILSIIFVALCSCFFIPTDKVFAIGPPQATWTGAVSTDWNNVGNWTTETGLVPDINTIVVIPDAATTPNDPGISAGATCFYMIIEASGILNGNGQTITVRGDWTNGGTFNHGNGTIVLGSFSDATFTPGSSTYYNIEINKTDASFDNLTVAAGTLNIAGNLTVTDGDLYFSTNNTTVNITGNVSIAAAGAMYAGTDAITVNGNWANAGTFSHGNGKIVLTGGSANSTFTPGSSAYNNIEINKTNNSGFDKLTVSGTATVAGNLTHTDGRILEGQIDLAGNHTIGASASASDRNASNTIINFNHASNNQSVVYTAGGEGSHIRIDKTGGTFSIGSDVSVGGWEYVQGTVSGVDNHTITFTGEGHGNFIPGALIYNNIVVNKYNATHHYLYVSGTATVSGNLTHTDGRILEGQINLAGNYIVGASASTGIRNSPDTIINFNHASNNQSIVYTAGGEGAYIRIDKAGGTFSIGSDIAVGSWEYVRGTVSGVSTHTITLTGGGHGSFIPGALTYNNIVVNKYDDTHHYLTVGSGTLNISGNLTLSNGHLYLNTNNPTVNVTGNISITSGEFYAGTNTITVSGNWTNSGTFNHGSGTVKFTGTSDSNFTPGSSAYNNLEVNKTGNIYNHSVSFYGTATLAGNLIHTDGQLWSGQIDLAGNYTIGALAEGATTIINCNHASNNQAIVYSAGGVGAQVRIDKAGGTFSISSNIVINGWTYIQGAVNGLDSYTIIFGGVKSGTFTPGALTYGNIELNKTGGQFLNELTLYGTATISGNLSHTNGELWSGQIDLAGNYTIGASAVGASTIINFNHASNNQSIIYIAGGAGATPRIDKAGGIFSISSDISLSGWIYVRGTVSGVDNHTLIFGGGRRSGNFTPGSLVYNNIQLSKTGSQYNNELRVSAGTLNIGGALAVTNGLLDFQSDNPTVNITGNVSIAAAGSIYAGTNTITVSGNWTNSGTFSHGNGRVVFYGSSAHSIFTPGSSTYYNLELNKWSGYYLQVSGTATVAGDFTHTDGESQWGTINLSGNYIIGASSRGSVQEYNTDGTVVTLNGAGSQTIIHNVGGIGDHISINKTSGTVIIPTDIVVNSWTYIQGTVTGLDTHTLIFGDNTYGYFTPGSLIYSTIDLNKTGGTGWAKFTISGTATVTGDFIHTAGDTRNGALNVAGDYIIGANSYGGYQDYNVNAATVTLDGAGDQSIIYTAGGIGDHVVVDKASGILTISSDITLNGWAYTRGTVMGLGTYTLTLGDDTYGSFSPGNLAYGNVVLNKTASDGWNMLTVSGTLNMNGNLTLTDGQFVLNTNNPTINLSGNLSINSLVTYTRGTGTLTFNGTTPSTFTDLSDTPQNLGKLAVNKTSTTETQNNLTLASSLTCNTLSIDGTSGQADTLDLGSGGYTLTLSNAGNIADVFTVNGTITPGDSTIKYAATNSVGSIDLAPTSYDNLELSGTETYALAGSTTLTGSLIIGANSTLLAGTNTLNLAGNLTNSGTFTPDTSTVNLTGTNQTLSGNTTFYNLNKDITSSDTLTFAANSTTTINPNGTLTLKGQDRDNRLSLISSTPDTEWNLAVNDASIYDFDFLNVQDSNATTRHLSVLNSLSGGNNTNWTIVNNTATGIAIPSINVAGSIVTIHTTASDTDHDNISLKIEYSQDNGSTWHDPYLSSVTSTSDTPTLNNASEYQITTITTSSDNTVTILWDTKSEQNELSSILYEDDVKIKLTPYDGTDIGSSQTSSPFEVNNRSAVFVPSPKPDLSDAQISSDNNILHFINLPANITQIAISSTSDFQEVSYQDINDIINLSDFTTDTLYFKFRTSQGSTSDTITYNRVSHSIIYDLKEGDIVKTKDNFDVYIIKYKNGKQYKRLILSPSVFNSYHHLKWENIKIISQAEMDRYVTSNLVKETTDITIFELFPNGDIGERRKLDISKPYDVDSVYEINRVDRDSYILVK